MLNFCTLFDINFATQGLVMYESLKKHCDDFHLYIFAFCEDSYKLLSGLNLEKTTIISLSEFEDEELLKVKPTRTAGEYCWTCSSSTIKYCIEKFNLDHCTYIDADLCFYSNPKVLVDEMGDKSVLITEHRYTPEYDQTETSGKYCVQFITFKNDENGLKVLNWWRNACLDWCYAKIEDNKFGDQKYLDDWTQRFDEVHVLEHLGGGVAPWNINNYNFNKIENKIILNEKNTSKNYEVIFYHFHSVKVDKKGRIDRNKINFYRVIPENFKIFYMPYIKKLINTSRDLHKINSDIKIIKKPKIDFKYEFKNFKKKIIKIRFSSKNPELCILGIDVIKIKK